MATESLLTDRFWIMSSKLPFTPIKLFARLL